MDFQYVTTCFKCIIICRTEYLFLSKQPVMSVRKTAGFLSLNRLSEMVWDSKIRSRGPERQQLWGRGRFWRGDRGVTPATGPTNIQRSLVQQFVSVKCLWWRENFFRVSQVNRSKHQPRHSGLGPLALTEVSIRLYRGPKKAKKAMKRHIENDESSSLSVYL